VALPFNFLDTFQATNSGTYKGKRAVAGGMQENPSDGLVLANILCNRQTIAFIGKVF